MALELCILASGSAGNCSILRTDGGAVLIDAGIGPRTTARRLAGTGIGLADIRAICLTHLDSDHFRASWVATIISRGIRLYCHGNRHAQLLEAAQWARQRQDDRDLPASFAQQIHRFAARPFEVLPGVALTPLRLDHDELGSHGFVIEAEGSRLGYATDLGRVPDHLLEHFRDLDMLALESNYDRQMELSSARPWFLKKRIMGGAGHLSNEQAFEAVRRILDDHESRGHRLPGHIILLHRSRECNCPKLLRRFFEQDARIAPRLTLAEQYERTGWLKIRPRPPLVGEQLSLAW